MNKYDSAAVCGDEERVPRGSHIVTHVERIITKGFSQSGVTFRTAL